MSSQKGNTKRARPQKYQNNHAFKNDLHDKSTRTKAINNIQVVNVCDRCKKIIEWKIKYKKYKPLKAPAKCTKCEQKVIKHAYHILCGHCALNSNACPKCGEKGDIVREERKEELKLDRELRLMLKKLPERKRRTFMRYMNRKAAEKEKSCEAQSSTKSEEEEKEENSETESEAHEPMPLTRDDLLDKLKTLMISTKNKKEDDEFGSDFDDLDSSDYDEANS